MKCGVQTGCFIVLEVGKPRSESWLHSLLAPSVTLGNSIDFTECFFILM